MRKNPKLIAGAVTLAVLAGLSILLLTRMIPTIGEVRREMSLTPTPLPPVPDTVWMRQASDMVTPEPPLHNGSQGEKVWDHVYPEEWYYGVTEPYRAFKTAADFL